VEEGNNMPRRYRHSRAAIHDRQSEQWDHLEPLFAQPLTPRQVQEKRLELIVELVELVLTEAELARQPRQTLKRIYTSLGNVWRQL
jgi:hypothetical protein